MSIKKYRKKPVEVEALQWMDNNLEMAEFLEMPNLGAHNPNHYGHSILKIITSEGIMEARLGDYVIKGIAGEYYPCKPDIFERTYEEVK